MERKKHVYCINVDCSKKETCLRFNGDAGESDLKKRYLENFDGKACQKYILRRDGSRPHTQEPQQLQIQAEVQDNTRGRFIRQAKPEPRYFLKQEASQSYYSSNSDHILMREKMLLAVEQNFDALFMNEMAFRGAEFFNINRIASRVVDLLMPIVAGKDKRR